jgi:hypothetical protein
LRHYVRRSCGSVIYKLYVSELWSKKDASGDTTVFRPQPLKTRKMIAFETEDGAYTAKTLGVAAKVKTKS